MSVAELLNVDERREVRILDVRDDVGDSKQLHRGNRSLMPDDHDYVRAPLNQRIRQVGSYEPVPTGYQNPFPEPEVVISFLVCRFHRPCSPLICNIQICYCLCSLNMVANCDPVNWADEQKICKHKTRPELQ